jgi:hypothetical protein
MDRHMSNALDNWITGHHGADQFRGEDEYDEFVDKICSDCMFSNGCLTFEKFYNGVDYEPCLIVKAIMEMREAQDAEYERDADEHYALMEEELLAEDSGTWISDDPSENWSNNYLQFARLIAECNATGAIFITEELCNVMNLSADQVGQIIERAQYSWDKIQEQLKVRDDKLNLEIEKAMMEDDRRNGR